MNKVKNNVGFTLQYSLRWSDGTEIDLRKQTGLKFDLYLPDDTTIRITAVGYDAFKNKVWVRVPANHTATAGVYKGQLSVMTKDLQLVTTGLKEIVEVDPDAQAGYKNISLVFDVTSIDTPANIGQGYSPKIVDGQWYVYDDAKKAYVPTGQSVTAKESVDAFLAEAGEDLSNQLSTQAATFEANETERDAIVNSKVGAITELQGKVGELEGEVVEHETRLSNAEKQIEQITGVGAIQNILLEQYSNNVLRSVVLAKNESNINLIKNAFLSNKEGYFRARICASNADKSNVSGGLSSYLAEGWQEYADNLKNATYDSYDYFIIEVRKYNATEGGSSVAISVNEVTISATNKEKGELDKVAEKAQLANSLVEYNLRFDGGRSVSFNKNGSTVTITMPSGAMQLNYRNGGIFKRITNVKNAVFEVKDNEALKIDLTNNDVLVVSLATEGNYITLFANCGDTYFGVLAQSYYRYYNDYNFYAYAVQIRNKIINNRSVFQNTAIPTTSRSNILSLLHFSDIHGDTARLNDIVKFRDIHSEYINDVLSTGDNVLSDYRDWNWDNIEGANKILNTIGNHDAADRSSGAYVWRARTDAQCYESQFGGIAEWGVQYQVGKCYYYKDYTQQSIRLIVLDTEHKTDEQTSWLVDTLNSAKSNNLSVIIAKHGPHNGTPVDCTFEFDKKSRNYGEDSNYTETLSIVDDYIQNGGKFICYLVGHQHQDLFRIAEEHNNQLEIGISNSISGQSYIKDHYRIAGDISENLFNIVSFDVSNGLIKILRVGCNEDVRLQQQNVICYDYISHKVLSNS